MIPEAYEFKRIASRFRQVSAFGFLFEGIETAPVYYFNDQESFDSDEVGALRAQVIAKPLRLPHPCVVFEVKDRAPERAALLVYARQFDDRVEAAFFFKDQRKRQWTDCLIHAVFSEPGLAEGYPNPKLGEDEVSIYGEVATGIVWRALSILSQVAEVKPRTIMPALRRKYSKAGVRGWTWHQITIDPERLREKSAPQGGTHASPRWHIRRGHWRQLADGRRVFVRQCQVGDPAQGGVVKDYIVKGSAA